MERTAEDVLSKLCGRKNVPFSDVEEALASDVLLSDMMATHKGVRYSRWLCLETIAFYNH